MTEYKIPFERDIKKMLLILEDSLDLDPHERLEKLLPLGSLCDEMVEAVFNTYNKFDEEASHGSISPMEKPREREIHDVCNYLGEIAIRLSAFKHFAYMEKYRDIGYKGEHIMEDGRVIAKHPLLTYEKEYSDAVDPAKNRSSFTNEDQTELIRILKEDALVSYRRQSDELRERVMGNEAYVKAVERLNVELDALRK